MTKKKVKSQPEEEVLPVVTEKKTPAKSKPFKPVVVPKPVIVPKAVVLKSAPIPQTPETITRAEHKAKIVGLMRIMTGSDKAAKEKAQAEINELNRMVYEKRVV